MRDPLPRRASMRTRRAIAALPWVLALLGGPLPAEERAKAEQGFTTIRATSEEKDPKLLDLLFPGSLVESRPDVAAQGVSQWRASFAGRLAKAKLRSVREEGDEAIVRLGSATEERELPLRWVESRWIVDAAQEYVVAGKALDRANGKAPARVRLTARTKNGPYGTSALSFAHATQDPLPSKNRMEVWFCHNGDFHFSRGDVATRVEAKSLDEVTSIPVGKEWKKLLPAERGAVYVVRAVDPQRRDFYVKMRVDSLSKDAAEVEWALLATGWNWPADVHETQPDLSNDGADGNDGLCGKTE
jgi:hypothetical protein